MPVPSGVRVFGPYRLDTVERLLLRSGQPVALTPKAFDLLVHLVERAGHLVTKHDLMDALWPDTSVEESNLTYTVSALRRALEDGKDGVHFIQTVPTRGYRFIADVTSAAPGVSHAPDEAGVPHRPLRRRLMMTGTLVAFLVAGAMVARQLREPQAAPRPSRTTIPLPDATLASHSIPIPQIAPDGRRVAVRVTSGSSILLRDMDDDTVTALAGTNGVRSLFWAPDSEHLAFTTASAVKTLRLSDGAIETLCESCEPAGGGTWSANGLIVFAGLSGSLLGVPSRGGAVETVTALDASAGETAHRAPHFLPDGQHFLYSVRNRDVTRSGLYVGELGSGKRRLLIQGDTQAVYADPGYVLFLQADDIMARPFDVADLEFTGEASPVATAESLRNDIGGQPAFSASSTGVLTYAIFERPLLHFQWVGRDGESQDLVGEPDRYYTFDLSPDARRLVYSRRGVGDPHLWVLDIERGVTSPVTSGSGAYADPRWTDGLGLVATRWTPLPQAIVKIASDGLETPLISTARVAMVEAVSPDGTHLLYREQNGLLLAMPLDGGAEPLLVRRVPTGSVNQARFSPDGRWVAYHEADASGRFDVYVSPFPPTGEHWQLSPRGGLQPMWRHDSQEVYYLGLDGTMHAVTLMVGTRPPFSAAMPLFRTGLVSPASNVEEYAVSSDGERFLLLRTVEDRVRSSVGVIFDWPAMLRR